MTESRYEQQKRWKYESGSIRGAMYAKLARFKSSMKKKSATPIDLVVADLVALWETQGGRCAVSGVPLRLSDGSGSSTADSLTISRRDPTKPYSRENVRLVAQQVAYAMNVWGEDQLLDFCANVLKANGFSITKEDL